MTVSLGIIAYNEEIFIENIFDDILKQDYSHEQIEIILINSQSTDNTRTLMKNFSEEHKGEFLRIEVCDNEKKTLPCGWNVFLKNAECDIIIKWDAHARFAPDFISKSVECIETGEDVCGGVRPCIIDNPTPWKKTLLSAENSLFGSSFAPYRRNLEKTYVKSIFHGAYRKEVYEKIGEYNECLTRTEDNDIHYRIRQAGYKICFDDRIKSQQLMRGSFSKMVKQKFQNGKWIGLTLGVQPKCLELYHFVPFIFILGIILTTLLWIFNFPLFAWLMWGMYALLAIGMTVSTIVTNKEFQITDLLLPGLFLILHVSYGVGTVVGIIKLPFWLGEQKNGRI